MIFLKSEAKSGVNHERIIFQVISGKSKSGDISDLYGTMNREKADMEVFITLNPPTSPMVKEANSYGIYHHAVMNCDYSIVDIITVKEILEGKQFRIPLSLEVLKTDERQQNPAE